MEIIYSVALKCIGLSVFLGILLALALPWLLIAKFFGIFPFRYPEISPGEFPVPCGYSPELSDYDHRYEQELALDEAHHVMDLREKARIYRSTRYDKDDE